MRGEVKLTVIMAPELEPSTNTLSASAPCSSRTYRTMLAMPWLSPPPSRESDASELTSQHPPLYGDSGYTTMYPCWSASAAYCVPP